ncbi:GmrSD restriction endonuclease domain-containing protein [Campylobacter avium]|uniref:GmrSD restriction endonuclease domain-containing protein n=1 Tax=Campylobacter avium TaxID=522485 RepID=UPI0031B9B61A
MHHRTPQNPNLSKEWQRDLGENYKEIQEKYLHTLGNLTLTGYNSEYKDKPFKEKRDMQGGFKQSPLKLNDGLRGLQTWNQETIEKRAEDLANKALEIWAMPTLEQALLDSYKQEMQNKSKKEYSLENYNFSQTTKEIFKALHKDIVALDENITQSYTKLYIAYKLETNIVDIVPQKSKLKLYLNIPFNELIDEKRMARNVANIGSGGNGDVEVSIESAQDIAYCLGLIRQALERQL